jgi:hypothetical protein
MPRKKRATTSKKNDNLEELSQTHAKEEKTRPSTLDQVWGDTGTSKYGHFREEEYRQLLKEMTKSDIHAHAQKMGLIPVDNREQLVKRLMKEFMLHKAKYVQTPAQDTNSFKEKSSVSPEVIKILKEGR